MDLRDSAQLLRDGRFCVLDAGGVGLRGNLQDVSALHGFQSRLTQVFSHDVVAHFGSVHAGETV